MKTTLEHRPNQIGRIVALLRSRSGEWVPLPEILELHISQYSARIYQARHEWRLNIENRVEIVNGQKYSWFRLIENPAPHIPSRLIDRHKPPSTAQAELFPPDGLNRRSCWCDPEERR